MKRTYSTLILLWLAAAAGCKGKEAARDGEDVEVGDPVIEEVEADAADAQEEDIKEEEAGGDEIEAPPPSPCEILGLPVREFIEAADDRSLYATAADFTVSTTLGDWNLMENWTGCDAYLFIQDVPRQTEGWPVPLWDRDVEALLARAPANTRFFFIPTSSSPGDREAAISGLAEKVEATLAGMTAGESEWWRGRIHYVTVPPMDISGWLGEILESPGWGTGIDRFQRIRYIGSYADWLRWDSVRGWFAPNLSMAVNEAIYYNFEAERQIEMEAHEAVLVPLFTGEILPVEGNMGYSEVDLPDAAQMETFDTMELDLYLGCIGWGEYGFCPPWDYIVSLYLCERDAPDVCDVEIGRWITTYHREGRWVHDVSGLLPLLAEGGRRRFAFQTAQRYEVKLDIRLTSSGRGIRPVEATYLFSGGPFDETYNDRYSPVTLFIPAGAVKVDLATVVTGHGMAEPGNCAEFCNTTHHFFVNGTENVRSFPEAGTEHDCMDRTAEGTVPNQYGTWWYGRSGWCPGKEVPMVMIDVTDQVFPGAANVFEYQGFRNGMPYAASGASIVMTSWVVVWI